MIEDIEPTLLLSEQFNYQEYLAEDLTDAVLPCLQVSPQGHNSEQNKVSCRGDHCRQSYYETSIAPSWRHELYTDDGVYVEEKRQIENREKKRLNNINSAFERLKEVIPTFPFEKRLTKMETLRLAISYISMLQEVLHSDLKPDIFIDRVLRGDMSTTPWYTHELSARLNWLHWENLGMRSRHQWEFSRR